MPAFIVAEAGVNHLGDRAKMLAFCDAAKACGADAVKFQAYNTDALITRRGIAANAMLDRYNVQDLLRLSELTDDDLDTIAAHCKAIGFKWFASVFDPSQVERVLSRGACALKVSHKEVAYPELMDAVCAAGEKTGVPVWLSGVNVYGVWEYPATTPPDWARLTEPGVGGFSSHYASWEVPAEAAAFGIHYLEVHMALSDADPEAAWSLMPPDFAKMVSAVRRIECAL